MRRWEEIETSIVVNFSFFTQTTISVKLVDRKLKKYCQLNKSQNTRKEDVTLTHPFSLDWSQVYTPRIDFNWPLLNSLRVPK